MRFVIRIVDGVLALPTLLIGGLAALGIYLVNRLRLSPPDPNAPLCWLTLTSGSYAVNAKRNMDWIYEACLLNGKVEHCYFLYFLAPQMNQVRHSPNITIIDFRSKRATRLDSLGLFYLSRITQQFAFLWYVYRLIRGHGINVIQANDPIIEGLTALIVSRWTRIPFFVRVMCDYEHYYKHFGRLAFPVVRSRRLERGIERAVMGYADAICPWNQNYQRYAQTMGAKASRTIMIGPFVDRRYFDPLQTAKADAPLFIYLGRLSWDKYCLDLLGVLAVIVEKQPRARLVILGDGDLRGEMEVKARDLGITANLSIEGFCDVEMIRKWASRSAIALATHGGFALIELGAMGLPTIAYDYEWHGELLQDGVSGCLVPFRDGKQMGQTALRLLADPVLARELASKVRATVHERFHPSVIQRQTECFFRLLLRANLSGNLDLRHEMDSHQ